jgi:hypothetical protein
MDAQEVEVFLAKLGCSKIKRRSGWVNATCPFGVYHWKGKDDVPSFGISISPGDESRCRCQACGVHGALMPVIWRLENLGRDYSHLISFLAKYNQFDVEKLKDEDAPANGKSGGGSLMSRLDKAAAWGPPKVGKSVEAEYQKQQAEVAEPILEKMRGWMTDEVREYLSGDRQLKPLTVEEWELGWHPKESRLCIPVRDRDGKLVSISGRALVRDSEGKWTDKLPRDFPAPKYLHSPFSRNTILYGMHKLVPSKRVGYLFEGFFQAIFSWQCGYDNVLARMGTHLSGQQRDMLRSWFDKLILVPDGDPAGYDSVAKLQVELEQELDRIPEIVVAKMEIGKDADSCDEDLLKQILGSPNE